MKNNSKEITGVIYKFQNKLNNKIYIGQTRCEKSRYNKHVYCKDPKYEIDRAIKCYGIENFTYEIIESYTSINLDDVNNWMDEKEEFYIKEFNSLSPNGYNLLSSKKHPEFSETTRKKISEACKGEKNGFYGRKHSEETRQKMRESAAKRDNSVYKGRIISREQVEKRLETMKGYWINLSDERKQEIINKQQEERRNWRNSLTDEEYAQWNNNRIKKSKETYRKHQNKGSRYNTVVIHKDEEQLVIKKDLLDEYLNNGWEKGMTHTFNTKAILYYHNNIFIQEYNSFADLIKTDIVKYIKKKAIGNKLRGYKTIEKYNSYQFVYKCDVEKFSNNFNELIIKTKEK